MSDRSLTASALAEAIGTGFLLLVVVGSGIMADRLSPDDAGLRLLENSSATALGLVALILAFGAISGAHLNPVVTLAERCTGKIDGRIAGAYIAAQLAGGCVGSIVANLMFELPAVDFSTHDRIRSGTFLGEVVATFGLLLVIFGVVRTGRANAVPVAVGGYIGAAYWCTSSTSVANPAATIGRTLTESFAGIAPASAPPFIAAQLLGAALAVGVARILFEPEPSLVETLDG